MALRDQPYIPLYVQDLLTDEKLIECSAESHGIYLRLICILHKQQTYGKICLKQKYKQSDKQIKNFAYMLSKQMPWTVEVIERGLKELNDEKVINIINDILSQKRMVKDGELSIMRTEIGKKGGSKVTKQYGKKGYLYLMSDSFNKHKIGISVNPQNRLYRIRSDNKLPKHFEIKDVISVDDMGIAEDNILLFFKDFADGEWLEGEYIIIKEKFDLFKAKVKANIPANSENENENENELKKDDHKFHKFLCDKFLITEIRNPDKFLKIGRIIIFMNNQGEERSRFFRDSCWYYFKYKELSGEKTHNLDSFLGTFENKLSDGGWNAANWEEKLKEIVKDTDENSTVYPGNFYKNKRSSKTESLSTIIKNKSKK